MLFYERLLWDRGLDLVCGVDEVGRGPLAGPVVASAVVFPQEVSLPGVKDSKKLTAEKREEFFGVIYENALGVGIGVVDEKIIDQMNILNASLLAMQKAIKQLKRKPDVILIDGNQKIPHLKIPQIAVIKGDSLSLSIAAASIIAKVTRDRLMEKCHKKFPLFCFDENKGYSSKSHLEALENYGPCEIHRKSFKTVKLLKLKQEKLEI